MKKTVCFCSMMASLAAFAGSAEAVGTDWVVTAAAGESYTNSTAVGNYSRLVKQGDGEVVLTAATTAFTGAVVVQDGTLSITDLGAVGSGTPVTVQSGATFYLKTPHTGGQTTALFTGHDITIAGSGVGGAGALRYKQASGGGMADNLFGKITLSGDATISGESRWGMYGNTKILDLAGHTLTRIGGGNWMVYNHFKSTGGPGTIINKSGTMTLQGSLIIDPNVTVVVTNTTMALWSVASDANIKGTIRLYSANTIQAQSGVSKTVNHLGPVHVFGNNNSNGQLATWYNSKDARSISIDGTLSSDSTVGIYKSGTGTLYVNGDVNQPGGTKNFSVGAGTLYFSGDKSRSLRLVQYGESLITQEDGHTLIRMLRIANGGATSAAYRQLGGVLAVVSGDNGRIGESNGSRGYYTLEGGEFHASNTLYLAEKPGSFGAFKQTGGLMELKNPSFSGAFCAGRGGNGLFVQTGGTNDTLVRATVQDGGFHMGTNGQSVATISGTGTLFRTSLLQMGETGSLSTNILNIKDGAVVKANRFRKWWQAADGARAYVNADGGTLMPTFFSGWGAADGTHATFYKRSPDHLVIWKKGLVIDTSENSANSSAGSSSISFWFEPPTGNGVESVALPTASGFVASNYLGIASVVFEDATGWGASAYAEYDFGTKKVTRIVVTSRGCDYSADAKAYLESPDRTTRYECALTLSSNAGMCGELVKRGAPLLYLYATNTITGGIAVESGTLTIVTGGVIPSNTPVRVESGATLNLNNFPVSVSTFTGAGTVSGGAVTVTNAVRASCAELFADNNKHATFGGNLTFAPGATFTITDPENLDTYKNCGSVTAFTAASVTGTPTLAFEGGAPQGVKWSLFKKNDTTYNFGAVIGTMILLR